MNPYYKPSALWRPFQRINFSLREAFKIIFKITGILLWLCILVLALLEVKRYYNIDVIPGYNSPVDNIYGAVRSTVADFATQ